MNREQVVKQLTEFELCFLLNNPDQLDEVARFFVGGGFNNYSDEQLQKIWDAQIKEEA